MKTDWSLFIYSHFQECRKALMTAWGTRPQRLNRVNLYGKNSIPIYGEVIKSVGVMASIGNLPMVTLML